MNRRYSIPGWTAKESIKSDTSRVIHYDITKVASLQNPSGWCLRQCDLTYYQCDSYARELEQQCQGRPACISFARRMRESCLYDRQNCRRACTR